MNKTQLKGTAKKIGGKIQEEAGKLTGNGTQQAKGIGHQVEGSVEKGVGDIKGAAKNLGKKPH